MLLQLHRAASVLRSLRILTACQDTGREAEADPNGPDREDLDAEDADYPMMVSEYVTEIFDYLKVVEVRFSG